MTTLHLPPPWLLEVIEERRSTPLKFPTTSAGKIPHGRDHDVIVSTAASLASRIGGLDESGLLAALRGALAPLIDYLEQHDAEIRDATHSALAKYGKASSETALDQRTRRYGRMPWRSVRDVLGEKP